MTESPAADVVEFLPRVSLFAHIKREFMASIAARLETATFAAGEIIFDAGDASDTMFIVYSGSVGVYFTDPRLGLRFELASIRSGEVFGEMALVTQRPRTAMCRALEPTHCLVLSRSTFMAIVERVPQVALSVAEVLADRVDQVNRDRGHGKLDLADLRFDADVLRAVPGRVIERHRMIPVNIISNKLILACVDSSDAAGIDEVRRLLRGVEVQTFSIHERDFYAFFERHAGMLAREVATSRGRRPVPVRWIGEELKAEKLEAAGDAVKHLVDMMISQGVELEASDVHIEPELDAVMVRYRIAGRLVVRQGQPIPRSFHRAVASRIKVLADLDISERRRPQEGRISCVVGDRRFDLRVSTLPTHEGEKIVMRILDSARAGQPLEHLILADRVCGVVHQMVRRPHGTVFVCGPTGSGKTTTLYAAVGMRRRPDTNITTVEDPVEYNLPGVTQVSVNPEIGLTFASVLRSILRQDPNVIMVGETRDHTTAKIVLEAGLTGHLVLTSMHTNDALSAIQRLREMGVENYAIAASLVGVISQRLVRRLCPNCAQEDRPTPQIVEQLYGANIVNADFAGPFRKAVGCNVCDGQGYQGRVGVYELLVADDELRQEIINDAGQFKLRETALKGAFVPMARYSNFLLTNGWTTPSELLTIQSEGAL